MQKLEMYRGPITGGYVLCTDCEPKYEAEHAERSRAAAFGDTAIPPEFADATWESFLPRAGTELARDICRVWYQANDGRFLYLTGPVGSGKTRLACTLAAAAFRERTTSVLFVHVVDLFDRLRAAEMKGPGEDDNFRIPALAARQLLVLDDLGVEKPTEYTCTRLLQLLERRHQAGHPTIITSNLSLDALGQRLGDDRIPSRLADWADLAIVRATDYRLERAGQRAKRKSR
jgi:DNA replication protein DnaC